MIPRYARDASDEFNSRLDASLRAIGDEVRRALGRRLVAVVLGGGYGRGEGGLVVRDGRENCYNDLDFTLVTTDRGDDIAALVKPISHRAAGELGIEVDFSRPLTVDDIRSWPHTLMWQDLLLGHRVIEGPQDVLAGNAPASLKTALPAIEGLRLLLNRGAGILWALRVVRGIEPAPDPDFVRRNYQKCALAMGDALLIAHKCYRTPYTGRDELVAGLLQRLAIPSLDAVGRLYPEALAFKFRPDRTPPAQPGEDALLALARHWSSVVLDVESVRTGRPVADMEEFVAARAAREPAKGGLVQWPANLARNLKLGRFSLSYPRERLYRDLPVLLGLSPTSAREFPRDSAEFLKVWSRYN